MRGAIVGAGGIASMHANGFKGAGVELSYVVDVNEDAAKAFASKFGGEVMTDYKAMLKKDVDIVSISTPPFLHAPMTVDALRAGKHVICEKPYGLNTAEVVKMKEEAEKAKKVLAFCSSRFRYSPVQGEAKKIVSAGKLGQIYQAELVFIRACTRPGMEYQPQSRWFLDLDKAGGGVVLDLTVYQLDSLLYLMPDLEPVSASATWFRGIGEGPPEGIRFDVEEHLAGIIRCKNDMTVLVNACWAAYREQGNEFNLLGTKGGVTLYPFAFYTDFDGTRTKSEPQNLKQFPHGRAHVELVKDVLRAIEGDEVTFITLDQAVLVGKMIDALYRSCRSGKEEPV